MARSRVFFSRFLSLFDRTESYSPSVKIRRCPYCNTYRDGRNMLAEHSTGCLIHYLAQSYASPLSLSISRSSTIISALDEVNNSVAIYTTYNLPSTSMVTGTNTLLPSSTPDGAPAPGTDLAAAAPSVSSHSLESMLMTPSLPPTGTPSTVPVVPSTSASAIQASLPSYLGTMMSATSSYPLSSSHLAAPYAYPANLQSVSSQSLPLNSLSVASKPNNRSIFFEKSLIW